MRYSTVLDPNADGSQWLYREMAISEQIHPKLLPYACYDLVRDEFLIGVAITKSGARKLIDRYISDEKNWLGYDITHL